ncbi:MAG: hypothetical protein Q7S31_01965 [bacterium]|nr:hypothetical protein [bacterium]
MTERLLELNEIAAIAAEMQKRFTGPGKIYQSVRTVVEDEVLALFVILPPASNVFNEGIRTVCSPAKLVCAETPGKVKWTRRWGFTSDEEVDLFDVMVADAANKAIKPI